MQCCSAFLWKPKQVRSKLRAPNLENGFVAVLVYKQAIHKCISPYNQSHSSAALTNIFRVKLFAEGHRRADKSVCLVLIIGYSTDNSQNVITTPYLFISICFTFSLSSGSRKPNAVTLHDYFKFVTNFFFPLLYRLLHVSEDSFVYSKCTCSYFFYHIQFEIYHINNMCSLKSYKRTEYDNVYSVQFNPYHKWKCAGSLLDLRMCLLCIKQTMKAYGLEDWSLPSCWSVQESVFCFVSTVIATKTHTWTKMCLWTSVEKKGHCNWIGTDYIMVSLHRWQMQEERVSCSFCVFFKPHFVK